MKYIIRFNEGYPEKKELHKIVEKVNEFQNNDKQFMFISGDIDIIEIEPLGTIKLKEEDYAKD